MMADMPKDMPRLPRLFFATLSVMALTLTTTAQERDRSKIPEKYKWNLTEIYRDETEWRAAKDKLAAQLPDLGQYKGKLGSSAATLATALERTSALNKDLDRIYSYAALLADEDSRNAGHQGMKQEMAQLAAAFGSEVAYVEPEILGVGKATIDQFIASEPRLKIYTFYLNDILRRQPHTLSDSEEKLLAGAGPLAAAAGNAYNIFTNADFPYPSVTLSDGRTVKLDQAAFTDLRSLPNRSDRDKVMAAFFGALGSYQRTFGTTMDGEVQKVSFFAKARKYNSSLEAALDSNNIPVSVYSRLIDGVGRSLPTFHRYLKLRQRMMGVDQLHYYDLYAPLVGSVKLEYGPEQAEKLVLESLDPLGPQYQAVVERAFNARWIDLFPSEGKVSGAYSQGGVYDLHPYMLINYNGKYNDVTTVAHEMGHTMQSYLSNKTQPYPLSGYPIFVAEVASTFNEALLIDHMLKTITDPDARLSLLGNYLENIKGTVFRQTQFAEFELRMHEMAQKGQPITGEALAKLYMDIAKRY